MVYVTRSERHRIELLGRRKGISPEQLAERLLRSGIEAEMRALPEEVATAIDTLAADSDAVRSAAANPANESLVEYQASRLRFVKSRIADLAPGGRLRIIVPGEGIFEFSKEEFEIEFRNVLDSSSYNDAGYYHYATIPQRAMKYRVADCPK